MYMKKTENANETKKEKPKTSTTKSTTKKTTKKDLEDVTVRDLNTEKSVLEDLGLLEKIKTFRKKQKEENIRYNKEYGFDIPFINEMMNKFNNYLNTEGKQFIDTANESMKESENDDDSMNLYLKLILSNDKERILFKELLMTTEKYPIFVTIGDYDFFFEYFDDEQDPIFSFNKENFAFFFSNDLNKLIDYLRKSKVLFGVKYDKILTLDGVNVKIIEKKKIEPKVESETPKQESTPEPQKQKEKQKEDVLSDGYNLKNTYRVRLIPMIESDGIIEVFVVTDKPGEIFNYYGVDVVKSIKLIGNGITI